MTVCEQKKKSIYLLKNSNSHKRYENMWQFKVIQRIEHLEEFPINYTNVLGEKELVKTIIRLNFQLNIW
jgi:hypothetical protein